MTIKKITELELFKADALERMKDDEKWIVFLRERIATLENVLKKQRVVLWSLYCDTNGLVPNEFAEPKAPRKSRVTKAAQAKRRS